MTVKKHNVDFKHSFTFHKNSLIYFSLSLIFCIQFGDISSFLSFIYSPVSQRLSALHYFLCTAYVLEWTLELLDILEYIYVFLPCWPITGDFSWTSYDREWSHEASCQNNPSSRLWSFECWRASEGGSPDQVHLQRFYPAFICSNQYISLS